MKRTQKNLLLVTVIAGLILTSYRTQAKELSTIPMTSYGEGNSSCGSFVESRQDETQRYIYLTWLNGYLTAINKYEQTKLYNGAHDIKAGQDPQSLLLWIENYCRENPLESFIRAVFMLQKELQK